MNVFVLCTGRCGSTTFIEACSHITNYTAGHETRKTLMGPARVEYAPDHIEADNRLVWYLGRLEDRYGDDAIYVHLLRDRAAVARSFEQQYRRSLYNKNIIFAYIHGVAMVKQVEDSRVPEYCEDFCDNVNTNIEVFLRNKSRKMTMHLETAADDFREFWDLVGARGDLDAALATWAVPHNATKPKPAPAPPLNVRKVARFLKKVPKYYRQS